MSLIDTYQIATVGQNSRNTFTLASNGILVDVVITDLPDITIPSIGEGGGGSTSFLGHDGQKEVIKKHRKKITVTATIAGVKYTETKIVEDKPKLQIKDIDVNVTESKNKKPTIKIIVN